MSGLTPRRLQSVSVKPAIGGGSQDPFGRVTLITAWFGDWKCWINLYLLTCAHNPGVRWIFLHDQEHLPDNRPSNVVFHRTSLGDLRKRFKDASGMDVMLDYPYKACDIKPALATMFPDFGPYEWWGYCDSDLLWGNISRFISDTDLQDFDVISSHVCTIAGQFTIFRGAGVALDLFRGIEGLKERLAKPAYEGLDELLIDQVATEAEANGSLRISRRMLQVWERIYEPTWEYWASTRESQRLGHRVEVSFLTGPCVWQDGTLRHEGSGTEMMIIHFQEWKGRWALPVYPWPMRELLAIRVDEPGFGFVFKTFSSIRNLWIRVGLELPYRALAGPRRWKAKGLRGFRKIMKYVGAE